MDVRVAVTAVLITGLLIGTGPISAVSAAAAAEQSQPSPFALQQGQLDADEVQLNVALQPNGTAEWTLEFWVRLDDNESTTAFESLRDDIHDDPENYTQSFADRMTETATAAQNATGREMSIDGVAVETERQSFAREYGVIRYTFRWHGFAAVDGNELHAGDAIEGIYIDDGTQLLLEWPDGYERVSVAPDPTDERDHAVLWRGSETDFVSGEPRVVVTAGGSLTTAMIAGVALVVVALGAGGTWWYRNHGSTTWQTEAADGMSSPEPAANSGTTASAADDTASATDSSEMDLLSNEEQVLRLIRDNGGRMKQQAVVQELGWTDAKTSKVVTGLREEGELESFRLGRENVLSLPEADEPTAEPDSDSTE